MDSSLGHGAAFVCQPVEPLSGFVQSPLWRGCCGTRDNGIGGQVLSGQVPHSFYEWRRVPSSCKHKACGSRDVSNGRFSSSTDLPNLLQVWQRRRGRHFFVGAENQPKLTTSMCRSFVHAAARPSF
ncbi:unnamed protein product [Prorocentrum cordatum]|uniref:Uncharacterized protein n=1 Tax=Prorocentrum cordatum TaxID=2364126 RepID=A0ABN9X4I9_9DINO|nr:unnamed protein product [Polarella glacialis]